MYVNITNIKLEGKEELRDYFSKVPESAPFTKDILNNPEYYPIADVFRTRILQGVEMHCGAKIESCDMEFTDVHPTLAQAMQAVEDAQSEEEMPEELKFVKALFHREPYEKLPDIFKQLPFTTDMCYTSIDSAAMDRAYRRLLGITMDLLTHCTIDFVEMSAEEYYRHTDGCVRPTILSGIRDTMFEPYLQWKKLPKEASTFKFVEDNLGDLAAEVLQHPSNHYRVVRLMLIILYTRALAEPQSRFLDTYWSDDEEQAHNYLYYSASIHVLEQYLADMLMGGIFSHLNTNTESTMPKSHELRELYETAHRTAMSLNIKAHKLAMQTAANVAEIMRKEHLTIETTHVSAHIIEQDDEARCRIVEVRYRNTDTIMETCVHKIDGPPYVYTVHTQEYNAEKECWETTITQPFALSNGEATTIFSGEYGECMLLTDERLETVLKATDTDDGLSPAATNDFEDYKGTYMWPFPRMFKRLVARAGKNTLSLLKEYGNALFYLDGDDEDLAMEYC